MCAQLVYDQHSFATATAATAAAARLANVRKQEKN